MVRRLLRSGYYPGQSSTEAFQMVTTDRLKPIELEIYTRSINCEAIKIITYWSVKKPSGKFQEFSEIITASMENEISLEISTLQISYHQPDYGIVGRLCTT